MPSLYTLVGLAVTGLATAATAAAAADFSGRGQLRARWNAGDHADLGCLTTAGLWTGDESRCGTFVASPVPDSALFTLTSTSAAGGPCQVVGARFSCSAGNRAYQFGVSPHPSPMGRIKKEEEKKRERKKDD